MAATRLKTTKDGRAYYEIRYRTSREASELSTRWYVPSGWSEKAIQRELAKQAAEFERQCRAGLVISHREKKEIAAQEAARQAAEAAKIVTAKQYGERVLCRANSLEPSVKKRLPKIAAPIIRTCWINTFARSSANENAGGHARGVGSSAAG